MNSGGENFKATNIFCESLKTITITDINNQTGLPGQVLSSTALGIDWVPAGGGATPKISTVEGWLFYNDEQKIKQLLEEAKFKNYQIITNGIEINIDSIEVYVPHIKKNEQYNTIYKYKISRELLLNIRENEDILNWHSIHQDHLKCVLISDS